MAGMCSAPRRMTRHATRTSATRTRARPSAPRNSPNWKGSRAMAGDWIEVTPAYGRDYTRKADAVADWKAGLDFFDPARMQYLSIRDAEREGLNVIIRYAKLRKVCNTK